MRKLGLLWLFLSLTTSLTATAEPVSVKHTQGATRGFLVIRSESGAPLGSAEFTQLAKGYVVTSRLVYRFRDGSIDDETMTFTQHGTFHLLRDHHTQKGPFFPKPIDISVDTETGLVTSKSEDKDGKPKVDVEHMDIPADLANGVIGTLLLNIPKDTAPVKLGFLAPTGKGRLVKLVISPDGEKKFRVAGTSRTASVFRVHVDIGGLAGAIAPIVGKQPEDAFIWVLEGETPALIRQVGQLYVGGPTVSVELAGTSYPLR